MIGGGTPKTTIEEYWNGEIPWLSVVDFGKSAKTVYNTEKTITEKGLKESSTKILKKGQLIISARGTVGEMAMLGKDMAFNQSCYGLNATKETTNEFLYYLVKDSIGKIKQNTHGAVFDTITKQTFENIEVTIPASIEEQARIAQILTSLDDKIELNLQMNHTLEAIAQAIFKEWFVDFEFPGFDGVLVDGLPKGWKTGKLSSVCEIKYGKDHKHLEDGDIPVYGSGGIMRYADKALFEKESILIPRKGTLSNLFYVSKPVWSVDTMFYTIIKQESIRKYLFYLLKSLNLASMNVGSAVPSLTTEILNRIEIIIPDNKILIEFEKIFSSFYAKMEENINQIQTLIQIRDSLLPRLMSGKMEIK
jgi:type I restriction enzyme S subunit